MFVGGIGGYYLWCSYHPKITIQISDGGTGKEGISIEAPHIAIAPTGIANPDASIELKVTLITMQHESLCTYIKDMYKASDIKLDIETKGDQTILNYHGSVTKDDGEKMDYRNEIPLDFVLDASISK